MRKKRFRKDFPERHKALMELRKSEDSLRETITKKGASVILNINKHFLLRKPYKNDEYKIELLRHFNKPRKSKGDTQ